MTEMDVQENRFDVIIIGGRPAGATLATRLGGQGIKVLLIDRAKIPSLPAVSSPIIYACTMKLLDEIGIDEAAYARNTPKIRRLVTESSDQYRGTATVPYDAGRNYAYAVDRERFDTTLWRHAASFATVTACDGFAATDLLWNDSATQVVGIVGKPQGEPSRSIYADVVVGADGRWSTVARKVSAPLYNEVEGRTISYYYAYWKNVAPYDFAEPLMMTHTTLDGVGYLIMDSADNTTVFIVGGYSDILEHFSSSQNDAEAFYLTLLQHAPRLWARLRKAERVTPVSGIKHIENFYRQPYGKGWALIGDAAHHKDPLGGQGIYDAIFGAKAFAEGYRHYREQGVAWEIAMDAYKQALEAETLGMYRHTIAATRSFEPSGFVQRTLGRYVAESPEFTARMLSVPARLKPPSEVFNTPLMVRTVASGVARDARRMMTGAPSPAAVPPLPSEPKQPTASGRPGCLRWFITLSVMMVFGPFKFRHR